MNLIKTTTVLSSFLLVMQSCSSQKDFNDTLVIVKKGETVKIKGLDLKITNSGCGRQWKSSNGGESYEVPYCELKYVLGDSTKYGDDPVYFDNIEIKVDQMNVWNKEEEGLPGGACRISVKKKAKRVTTGK